MAGRLTIEARLDAETAPKQISRPESRRPPRKPWRRWRAAPAGAVAAVAVVAAMMSVDDYKTDLRFLVSDESPAASVAAANAQLRASAIDDATREAENARQVRVQGTGVLAIRFNTIGPHTIVQVQPPTEITLNVVIDGTDGYHCPGGDYCPGPLQTDAGGLAAFAIPHPKKPPVLDRVVVSTASDSPVVVKGSFTW